MKRLVVTAALLCLLAPVVCAQTPTPTITRTPTITPTPTSTPKPTSTAGDLAISRIYIPTPVYEYTEAKRRPTPGDVVTVRVEIRNSGGGATVPARLDCTVNGVALASQTVPIITAGSTWEYDTQQSFAVPLVVSCRALETTPQVQVVEGDNDVLVVDLSGAKFVEYVEQSVWDFFRINQQQYCTGQCYGRARRIDLYDWLQSGIQRMNDTFAANGVRRRVYLDRVVVWPDDAVAGQGAVSSCVHGSNHLQAVPNCQNPGTDCPGGICRNCMPQNVNTCDWFADGMWMHLNNDVQQPVHLWGSPPTYDAKFDVDVGEVHEWGHALGAMHTGIGITHQADVSIQDPTPTPVAGTARMPLVGTCAGGANSGLYCLKAQEVTDCPASTCSAADQVNFPPEEADWMGGSTASTNVSPEFRAQMDALYARRCRRAGAMAWGANVNSTENACVGLGGFQAGLHDIWAVAYDGGNNPLPSTTIEFYRSRGDPETGDPGSKSPNIVDGVADFQVTTDASGIAYLGAYPWVDDETQPASWCNVTVAGNCGLRRAGTDQQDQSSIDDEPLAANLPERAIDAFDADATLIASDLSQLPFERTSNASCGACNLVARVQSGADVGYTWLYHQVSMVARHDGRLRAYLPLWFWNVNHQMVTQPDLVVLPLTYVHDAPVAGGRAWEVGGSVANLGQPMSAEWGWRWVVDGQAGPTGTHRALYMGATDFALFTVAFPGQHVCLEADPGAALAEAREDNNSACVDLPSLS